MTSSRSPWLTRSSTITTRARPICGGAISMAPTVAGRLLPTGNGSAGCAPRAHPAARHRRRVTAARAGRPQRTASVGRRRQREVHLETAAGAVVVGADRAVVRLDEPARDREPEPAAGALAGRAGRRRRGTPRRTRAPGPRTGCRRSRRPPAAGPGRRRTSAATTTVPSGGVCRMALESRLRTTRASSGSLPRTTGHRQFPSARTCTPLRRRRDAFDGDGLGHHVVQRHGRQRQPQRSGGDPGELEQVVDHRRSAARSRRGCGGRTR